MRRRRTIVAIVPLAILCLCSTATGPSLSMAVAAEPASWQMPPPVNGPPSLKARDASLTYAGSTAWSGMLDILVRGDYAFCAMVEGLQILDISDPAAPRILSQLFIRGGPTYAISLAGNFVYAACGYFGLTIIDVTDPSVPLVISSIETNLWVRDVEVANGHAYIAFGQYNDAGLDIVDVSYPRSPKWVSTFPTEYDARGVRVVGNLAYVIENGVSIVDVSDPASPFLRDKFYVKYRRVYDLQIRGSLAYVTQTPQIFPHYSSRFQVLDITVPSSPAMLDTVELSDPTAVLRISDTIAFIGNGSNGVQIINVADPINLSVVGSIPTAGETPTLTVSDSLAFVASDRLLVEDVSDLKEPREIGFMPIPGAATRVAVAGTRAIIASDTDSTVALIDRADSETPPTPSTYHASGIAHTARFVDDSTMYVAASDLEIVDVSDFASPRLIGKFDLPDSADVLVLHDQMAFVGHGYFSEAALSILDVATPRDVRLLTTLPIPFLVMDIAVQGEYMFVACGHMEIYDISDPSNPVLAFSVYPAAGGTLNTVEVEGDYAYVGISNGYTSFLAVIDISDMRNMKALGYTEHPGQFRHLYVHGDLAFLGEHRAGVTVVDVSEPNVPHVVASYDTPGYTYGVTAVGDTIYLADSYGLLWLFLENTSSIIEEPQLPTDFALHQNYPNPFNAATRIEYTLERPADIRLAVYDILGRKVETLAEGLQSAGRHTVNWQALDWGSGVYFIVLEANGDRQVRKALLLK